MEKLLGRNLKDAMIQRCIGVEELARLARVKPYRISELLNTDMSVVYGWQH